MRPRMIGLPGKEKKPQPPKWAKQRKGAARKK